MKYQSKGLQVQAMVTEDQAIYGYWAFHISKNQITQCMKQWIYPFHNKPNTLIKQYTYLFCREMTLPVVEFFFYPAAPWDWDNSTIKKVSFGARV